MLQNFEIVFGFVSSIGIVVILYIFKLACYSEYARYMFCNAKFDFDLLTACLVQLYKLLSQIH
jgi:hypothetical protein